ncbi:lactate dehydrogenase [Pseudomonas sp. W2Oct36]|uniref:lactate dehydrogenase n=1 Tax=Pseudomonas sp. W2Oct36 TaxID=1215284 RepID=UPI0034E08C1B
MSAIASVTSSAQLMPVVKPAATVALNDNAAAATTSATPSSVVMLGQDDKVSAPLVYNVRGLMPDANVPPAWEYTRQDKVSLAMMGNFSTSATAGRFQGLGATLLSQLAQTGQNISQSVLRSTTGKALEPAELAAAQDRLHSHPANSISLTLKTASGKTIELSLSSQDDGLAVQAQVSGGDLSDDELNALNAMADGFQSAIDGLTAKPPTLKLDALTHFDSKAFASVDMKTSLKLEDGSAQTLELHADADQRSVRMSGALGNLELSVDLKNAAIRGDSAQQAKALDGYVSQIESARKRGDGDAQLLSMFEDAFKTLHSNYPDTRVSTAPQTVNSIELTDTDHGLLTGLGDFSASVSEKSVEGNPARPGELDSFAYILSQTTQSKGRDQLNRTIVQDQQSQLTASYHKPLPGGQKLALSTDPASQNYLYYQVSDQASSKTSIGYKKGELVDATLSQSASQSTRIAKYVMGRLEKDTHTPISTSKTQNFLSVLQQALQQDKEAKQGRGTSTLKDTLAGIHAKVLLQSDPSKLNG